MVNLIILRRPKTGSIFYYPIGSRKAHHEDARRLQPNNQCQVQLPITDEFVPKWAHNI